jgi:hypothetical protein
MIATDTTSGSLPPLYAAWMAELLQGSIPLESRATCDDCAMCASGAVQPGSEKDYFDPTIKCCSYIPELHNFLAGRILSDEDPGDQRGRASVENRIKAGVAVTPLGLGPPAVFSLLYENAPSAFGQNRTLRCLHYIEDGGGRCGIWRNREATCVTWFCKHDRGSLGQTFWRDSLYHLLIAAERALARWSVLELELGDETLRRLVEGAAWRQQPEPVTSESMDNRVDRDAYSAVWGKWLGREREFFVECARLVQPLSWNDALDIAGPEARAYARLTRDAYGKLISDELPSALTVGSLQLVQLRRDMTRVNTYSNFDPLDIPNRVIELLHFFDGRPTTEAIAAIAAETGIVLDQSLVRKMADFSVLVPSEQSD